MSFTADSASVVLGGGQEGLCRRTFVLGNSKRAGSPDKSYIVVFSAGNNDRERGRRCSRMSIRGSIAIVTYGMGMEWWRDVKE